MDAANFSLNTGFIVSDCGYLRNSSQKLANWCPQSMRILVMVETWILTQHISHISNCQWSIFQLSLNYTPPPYKSSTIRNTFTKWIYPVAWIIRFKVTFSLMDTRAKFPKPFIHMVRNKSYLLEDISRRNIWRGMIPNCVPVVPRNICFYQNAFSTER